MHVEICTPAAVPDWLSLRHALWPRTTAELHKAEIAAFLARDHHAVAFIVRDATAAIGFAEATLRHDYVNGCSTSPVAFLEGIYVRPEYRRRGAVRLLVGAVENWAIGLGCRELASDTELHNQLSQRVHASLGFHETERIVCYLKRLPAATPPGGDEPEGGRP